MSSFRAKLGWKRPRKSENKNYSSVPFLSDPKQKIKKKKKKIQKIKRYHYGFVSSPNRMGKDVKEKIKIIIPFRSYPTPNRKLQNKLLKNLKN